jgi:hypothetical protein
VPVYPSLSWQKQEIQLTTFVDGHISDAPPNITYRTLEINDIKLTLHTTFNIPKGIGNIYIRGCIVCPNGNMIFVDYINSILVILNDDGTLYKVITCSLGKPFDVTCLDELSWQKQEIQLTTFVDGHISNAPPNITYRTLELILCMVHWWRWYL